MVSDLFVPFDLNHSGVSTFDPARSRAIPNSSLNTPLLVVHRHISQSAKYRSKLIRLNCGSVPKRAKQRFPRERCAGLGRKRVAQGTKVIDIVATRIGD
jgi:hypothetical protein